jgi:hypothetical protein
MRLLHVPISCEGVAYPCPSLRRWGRRGLLHVADVLVGPGDILSDRLLSRRAPYAKARAHAAGAHEETDHCGRGYFEGRKFFKSSHY